MFDYVHERFPDIDYTESAAAAIEDADAVAITSDWDGFASLEEETHTMDGIDFEVVDGQRAIGRRDGITYGGLTW